MLDKRTQTLLNKINEYCPEGSYKVIDKDDFIDFFPSKQNVDAEAVDNMLKYLAEREYIDIKYSQDDTYCLCSLPKGRVVTESVVLDKKEKKKTTKNYLLIVFLGAFFGAMVGSIIVNIITSLFN